MRLPQKSDNAADIDLEQFKQMVDLFLEHGFTYFDTSYVYHDGASETAIREALVKRHPRDSFLLVSKFPTFQMPAEDKVEAIFQEQLDKCGVEYFDYYLLHNLNRYIYATEVQDAHLFGHLVGLFLLHDGEDNLRVQLAIFRELPHFSGLGVGRGAILALHRFLQNGLLVRELHGGAHGDLVLVHQGEQFWGQRCQPDIALDLSGAVRRIL